MDVGSKVLFRPDWQLGNGQVSMAREVGTVTAIAGDVVTIAWGAASYTRDRRTDFVREQL